MTVHGSKKNNGGTGNYAGSKNVKPTPTSAVPDVPESNTYVPEPPGPVKAPISHTPMPASKTSANSGRGKQYGGG